MALGDYLDKAKNLFLGKNDDDMNMMIMTMKMKRNMKRNLHQ